MGRARFLRSVLIVVTAATAVSAWGLAAAQVARASDLPERIRLTPDLSRKGIPGDRVADTREGGETLAEALAVPGLPFLDSGATCDNRHDYDESCPYSGSTARDVVYSYRPSSDEQIDIDLCLSGYDTKVYVYEDSTDRLVACNDDGWFGQPPCYTYASRLENVILHSGHEYFVVVDGYGDDCGSYALEIRASAPCEVACPDSAQYEGEPPCEDGYVDLYNGGCNSDGWTEVDSAAGGCATICGEACTFLLDGLATRDADWYALTASGGPVTLTATGDMPLQVLLIYGLDCGALEYDDLLLRPCEPGVLTRSFEEGETFWIWIGPSVHEGVPPSPYVFEVCGIEGGDPNPIHRTTWGRIKAAF